MLASYIEPVQNTPNESNYYKGCWGNQIECTDQYSLFPDEAEANNSLLEKPKGGISKYRIHRIILLESSEEKSSDSLGLSVLSFTRRFTSYWLLVIWGFRNVSLLYSVLLRWIR